MDVDSLSLSSSCHSVNMAEVVLMDTSKASVAIPQHVSTAKRNVRFIDDDNTTISVLSRVDYTMEEMTDSWYDRTDLKQMRVNARKEARLLEAGLLHETSTTSARGLEGRTTEGLKRKRRNRSEAVNAVFDELDQQEEHGISDDDAVADVYYVFTEHCQATAQMMGTRDANLAKEAYSEEVVENNQRRKSPDSFFTIPIIPNNLVNLSIPERLVISLAA